MPAGQEERSAALESAGGGVRGVRSGVDDESAESAAEAVAAGAAAAGVGAVLRVVRVVVKGRVAADARASGWAVICRVVNPAARRRHVRQIMVVWVWCLLRVLHVCWRCVAGWNWSELKISMEIGMGQVRSFDIEHPAHDS